MTDTDTGPLAWPSPDWDAAWQQAIDTTAQLALARQCQHYTGGGDGYAITGGRTPQQLENQLNHLLEALSDCTVAGLPVQRVRLTWTGRPQQPHPADKATLRDRLHEAAVAALADRAYNQHRATADARRDLAEATTEATHRLQPVADDHWTDTGGGFGGQTLGEYIAAMDEGQRRLVQRCLRLAFATAQRLAAPAGGQAPPTLTRQLDQGCVHADADLPQVDVDADPYPADLPEPMRDTAWELCAQAALAWNALDLPARRVVVARWHGLRLRTTEELMLVYDQHPHDE